MSKRKALKVGVGPIPVRRDESKRILVEDIAPAVSAATERTKNLVLALRRGPTNVN
jgi:hypothetical protein